MGLMPYQNGNAALINALSMLSESNKVSDFRGENHNNRRVLPKKRIKPTAPPKRVSLSKKTKVSAKPIHSKTTAKDDLFRPSWMLLTRLHWK